MKVGDLVRPINTYEDDPINWVGVVVGPRWPTLLAKSGRVVVYWNSEYPNDVECKDNLEVINESR